MKGKEAASWWQRVTEHATFAIPEGGEATRGGPDGNWGLCSRDHSLSHVHSDSGGLDWIFLAPTTWVPLFTYLCRPTEGGAINKGENQNILPYEPRNTQACVHVIDKLPPCI